jgi:Tfp pilus assembly protein PilO
MEIDRPIAAAIIFFSTVLLVLFLVRPEYKTFKSLQAELGERRAEFNAKYDYYAAVSKIYNDLKSRPEDIKKIDDALPENPELGRLVYFFQKTAMENGMIVKNLFLSKSFSQTSVKTKGENVREMVFSMDLLGDYSSLGNFIASLEDSAKLFEVSKISFNSGSQVQASSPVPQFQIQQIYSFNLQVKTYSY